MPSGGGSECQGLAVTELSCDLYECGMVLVLQGGEKAGEEGWGEWFSVGYCCLGTEQWTRDCDDPQAQLGCLGPDSEKRPCTGDVCGLDGQPADSGAGALVSSGLKLVWIFMFLAL